MQGINLNLCILCMLKDVFFLDMAHVKIEFLSKLLGGMRDVTFFIIPHKQILPNLARLHSPVDSTLDCRSRGRMFKSQLRHITFVKIDHSHYRPSADSRRAFVSYWQKSLHKYCITP